jgi:hypothetical protein
MATLLDILTKRDIAYQFLLHNKTGGRMIASQFLSTPRTKLITDLEPLFNNTDFIFHRPEVSSQQLTDFSSLEDRASNSINYSPLSGYLNYLNPGKLFNLNLINAGYALLRTSFATNYNYQDSIYHNADKSQYRPMRKGISNMVRLQATSAIAMPTELRLHILASSKDVIHS